jgi:hypothetical protein
LCSPSSSIIHVDDIVDAEQEQDQDPGRSSNSSAPDHSGGETSANNAGGDGFSGGCEREQREAGKRKRCEEEAATEQVQVRAKVQRYKRMTDRGGGRLGEQLEAQVQERPWRRARKRKRQEVQESETREADAVKNKTRQTHRRIETSRHSEQTLSMAAHAGRRNNIDRYKGR